MNDKLIAIICGNLNINPLDLKPINKFKEDLGADNLDLLEIIQWVEVEFNIEINDITLNQIKTFQDLINVVNNS